jgi:tetratricopeptide (TPR) repeat protein
MANKNLAFSLSEDGTSDMGSSKAGLQYGLEQAAALILAGAAIHVGEPDKALRALDQVSHLHTGAVSEVAMTEVHTANGAALAQTGRFDEAIDRLTRAEADALAAGPRANALSLLALAFAAAGRRDEAIEAARTTASFTEATYLDLALADVARGLASVQLGHVGDVDEAFCSALSRVDATGDRTQQAMVRLARARGLQAIRGREVAAAEAMAEAHAALDCIGLAGDGWDTIFCAASGGARLVDSRSRAQEGAPS